MNSDTQETTSRSSLEKRRARLSPQKRMLLENRLKGIHQRASQGQVQGMTPRPQEAGHPLSFAQERLWFLSQLAPTSPAYNRPVAFRLRGSLEMPSLEKSLRAILRRHEILRATFPSEGGQPIQVIANNDSISLIHKDLRAVPAERQRAQLQQLASQEAQQVFDLARGPLVRATLFHCAEREYVLLLVFHHIVFDAWSVQVLQREICLFYDAFAAGKPSRLPDPSLQYADYAHWQRRVCEGESLEKPLLCMAEALRSAPPGIDIATDRARPASQTFQGEQQTIVLPVDLVKALKELSQQRQSTLFMTLVTAFFILLYRYTEQPDLVIGCPTAGRSDPQSEDMIGLFVNTLVLRAGMSGNPPFDSLLQRIRKNILAMFEHRQLPFEKLVERLNPVRDLSRTPVFQVVFNMENFPHRASPSKLLDVEPFAFASGIAAFDLALELIEKDGELRCEFSYNKDLFDAETIARMSGHYRTLLKSIVADPRQRIELLPILSPKERQNFSLWNQTEAEYPEKSTIHQVFETQAEINPDAIALISSGESITYQALNEKANQLANHLQSLGVDENAFVAVCMERSIELVVALLGILKAGAAYAPLDPNYPKERLAFMIEDVEASVLITQSHLCDNLPRQAKHLLRLDSDWQTIAQQPASNLAKSAIDAPAYVIYTSGSTGVPKGVIVSHRGVLRLLFGGQYVQLGREQTHMLLAPISFDASIFELWGALLHGARCVLFADALPSPTSLETAIRDYGVTTLWLTSSLFNVVIDEFPQALREVRQLLIGGEALSVPHVRKGVQLLPSTQITNGYGPTETTVFAATYRIPEKLDSVRSIAIGRPIGNTNIYIVDKHLNLTPVGVPGELYIGGAGLALGYLHAPGLTAERFVPDPFVTKPHARMYKTGDLARYLADGNIEFLGRVDRQVKIRGFRIEPGEIEAMLKQHPAVEDVVVIVKKERGEKQLVAYPVLKARSKIQNSELQAFLIKKLPSYLIPAAYVFLDVLPRNPNGKIDLAALSALALRKSRNSTSKARTATERKLVKIWKAVLGVSSLGVTDNFFELGGHSLLAARLFTRIENVFGKNIPVSILFEAPTIEKLALIVDRASSSQRWSSLIAIKPEGSNPPFFCVAHGDVIGLERLGFYMAERQPFYGLQAPGLDHRPPTHNTVEDMASDYLSEIRKFQPYGPYFLGGRCIGAIVALEISKRLVEQGEEVALLVILDTVRPPKVIGSKRTVKEEAFPRSIHDIKRGKIAQFLRSKKKLLRNIFNPQERKVQRIREVMYRAREAYITAPYSGPLTLLQTKKKQFRQDIQDRWREATSGNFETYPIQGTHDSMWKVPWVADTARQLQICIDKALSNTTNLSS